MSEGNKLEGSKETVTIEEYNAKVEELERYKAKHELEKRHRKNAENEKTDFSKRLELLEQERQAKIDEAEAAKLDASRKAGDLEAIEKSHIERYETLKAETAKQLKERDSIISKQTAGQAGQSIASEVFGENAKVMMPHIMERISTEFQNGEATVRFHNADGTPSALTKEEFAADFKNNKLFANFVVGSKASGAVPMAQTQKTVAVPRKRNLAR